MAIRHDRDAADMLDLAIGLVNLAECLGQLGQVGPARDAAAEALTSAQAADDREEIRNSHAYLGWAAGLAGDTAEAERQFTAADQIEVADDSDGDHLYSMAREPVGGVAGPHRAGRPGPGADRPQRRDLPEERLERQTWPDATRCWAAWPWPPGTPPRPVSTWRRRPRASGTATTSPNSPSPWPTWPSCARVSGDLDAAERHATEAITIAAARGLVPAQAAALAARARIRAAQAAADPDLLYQGRDAADAALRLASPAPAGLASTGRAARPRRSRPGRGHRPGLGRQGQGPARPAGPAGPGPGPAGHRGTARRRPESRRRGGR